MNMNVIDWLVIVIYLAAMIFIGCMAGRRKKNVTIESEGKGYFLAGGTLTWPVIGLALFSTNISTIHLVSLAQEGYLNGLVIGNFEWMAAFSLIALSLFFAPFYIRAKVATLPDFLERRYNRSCRDWLAFLSIIAAIFIHISFSLYAGAIVLESMFGVNIFVSIVLAAVFSGLYTIIGGLMAVAVTGAIQTVILVLGAVLITAIGYFHAGGWEGIVNNVEPVKLTVLRSASDPSHLSWYSIFLGYPIIGLWYWCADQTIVQRVLGAKNENHARMGPLFAGFIKIFPIFIFVLPGLICLALMNQGKMTRGINPSGDNTYAFMVGQLVPVGLKGLIAAALLAALMSTVAGALNSIATLFSYDIYKRWRPEASERSLVRVGKWVTFFGMIAAILWSPYVGHYKSLFQGLNDMICHIAPPITTVFLWGIFWRKASARAAQYTLYIGSGLGLITFLLGWFKDITHWHVPFMMMAFYLFVICSAMLVIFSLLMPDADGTKARNLTWSNPLEAVKTKGWPGLADYRFLAAVLFVIMVFLYWTFR